MEAGKTISIFMPAYNAARHIESVIGRIPEKTWPHIETVWIINDGSVDTTGEVVEKLAKRYAKVKGIHLAGNTGYGTAVQIGLRKCREGVCGFAVCLHADGQYPPESIPEFATYMDATGCDILQGSRIASHTALSGGMPLYKYVAGSVLTFFENAIFDLSMTDYHSGFLVYSRNALERLPFHRLSRSFDFDVEIIAYARKGGLRIAELPIPTQYGDEISYLNPVSYGLRLLLIMGKYLLGMYGGAR